MTGKVNTADDNSVGRATQNLCCTLSTGRFDGSLFGARRSDGALKFLELLHLVPRLRGDHLEVATVSRLAVLIVRNRVKFQRERP